MNSNTPFYNFKDAYRQYGSHATRCQAFLLQGDPLADKAVAALVQLSSGKATRLFNTLLDQGLQAVDNPPEALRNLFEQLETVPLWVDWDRIEQGSLTLQRWSLLVPPVLSLYSLPMMYVSPAGTKPLVFTGNLVQRASRRLGETSRFVRLTCEVGGLKRFAEGFKLNVKVRLMHAQVRRLLVNSGRWNTAEWGTPINQCHMTETLLLISMGVIKAMKDLGVRFSQAEVESVLHLWAYSGYLSGIEPEFLSATEAQAQRLIELLSALEGNPSHDSRTLVQALRAIPLPEQFSEFPWINNFAEGLSRSLLGESCADGLDIPQSDWTWAAPLMRPLLSALSEGQRYVPGIAELTTSWGKDLWEYIENYALSGMEAEFKPPEQLASAAASTSQGARP